MDVASCLCCAIALTVCFAAIGLGGQNINSKLCSPNADLPLASLEKRENVTVDSKKRYGTPAAHIIRNVDDFFASAVGVNELSEEVVLLRLRRGGVMRAARPLAPISVYPSRSSHHLSIWILDGCHDSQNIPSNSEKKDRVAAFRGNYRRRSCQVHEG